MNKSELQKKLDRENITKDLYSLEGGLPNEKYCLNQTNNLWEVYYSERGQKTGLKSFDSEEEACEYFYNTLLGLLTGMGLN